jgi:hypothetical protein
MFSTTLAAAAVSGLLASGSLATQPKWQPNYQQALAQATEQQKPVAVFIARGEAGVTRLVNNEGVGTEAARLLRRNYVCLYVNTATESGKELAGSFNMTQGVVISDKTGAIQALRHEGTLSQADLTKYLTAQAQAGQAVVQTATYGAPAQAAVQQPPVVYPPQTYQPMYAQPRPLMNAVGNLRSMFGGG